MAATTTSDIRITKSALKHLKSLADEQDREVRLRVSVRQGGCSGMTYVISFEDPDHVLDGDRVYEFDNLKVVCDSKSISCVDGLVIDYNPSIVGLGGEFQFINPQAIETCCCGNSFTTAIS